MNSNRAALMLIAIFGMSVSTGLMAAHQYQTGNLIRQFTPPLHPNRKPDSETPKSKPSIQRATEFAIEVAADVAADSTNEVVVAVIDTGSDLTHPDLNRHAWINRGETGKDKNGQDKSTNGIDDDGNGYVDDVSGFDFSKRSHRVVDSHGHGTHIAGIIAKMAPRAKIMNLKYYDRGIDGVSALRNSLEAMRYAIEMKADIINYSGGGTVANGEELRLLREANRRGILVVAAAGNESTDSDKEPFYPANYRLPNILSVTAIDDLGERDEILSTSNFGIRSVAVAAQGKDVLSTLPGGKYGHMTGTSQATAFATSVAVFLIEDVRASERRRIPPEELIERIVNSSVSSLGLTGKTRFGSKLSAARAARFHSGGGRIQTAQRDFVQALEGKLDLEGIRDPSLAESATQSQSVCERNSCQATVDRYANRSSPLKY